MFEGESHILLSILCLQMLNVTTISQRRQLMDRWLVKVNINELARLQGDMRDLGTLLTTQQGENYLVFRDGFVALKVASYLGLKRQPGRTVPATSSGQHQPLMRFDNGDVLVAEA
jgi:hypothetical protein